MKLLIILNDGLSQDEFFDKNSFLLESAKFVGFEIDIKRNTEISYTFTSNGISVKLPTYDAVLFYSKDIFLAESLEKNGYKVFNSSKCISNCDNKASTYKILAENNLPIPKTFIIPLTFYYNEKFFENFIIQIERELTYPIIAKKWYGSEGKQVYLINNNIELKNLIKNESGKELLFQEYFSECFGSDIRINVVGNKAVSAIRRISTSNDFRANTSIGGIAEKYNPTSEEIDLAIRASKSLKCDFSGIDILQTNKGPIICEVNSNSQLKNIYNCCNVNVAEHMFNYIKSKI